MVGGTIAVRPLFATPFGETRLPNCERLNRELTALFLQRETQEHRNPTPSHVPQTETFESRFNLFRWPDSCVHELRSFMLNAVAEMVIKTTSLKPQDIAKLSFQNHTWFHISRYAGSFVAHNHPLASWSAVYCVRAGESVPQHPDSGDIAIPRCQAGCQRLSGSGERNLAARLCPGSGGIETRGWTTGDLSLLCLP